MKIAVFENFKMRSHLKNNLPSNQANFLLYTGANGKAPKALEKIL